MHEHSSSFGPICAIVVSHNPPQSFADTIKALLPQVESAVIVDNGSGEAAQNLLARMAQEYKPKLAVLSNPDNRGLAEAQNQGVQYASEMAAAWVLLLDDDSIPAPDMVEKLKTGYLNHSVKQSIDIVSPAILEKNTGGVSHYVLPLWGPFFHRSGFGNRDTLEPFAVIASGSLIKTSAFMEMGLFREEFFIDYVDTEFCLRLASNGRKILAVRNAILHHQLGAKTAHDVGSFTIIASNHGPERRFTIYRNRVVVWKRYCFRTPGYICYDMLAALWDISRILLFEREKMKKLGAALQGLAIGILR